MRLLFAVAVLAILGACDGAAGTRAPTTARPATARSARVVSDLDRLVQDWLANPTARRNEALLSRMLRVLGPAGLEPMMEALRTPGYGGEMDPSARIQMETALVEAIGRLDDPRALPLLRAELTDGRSDPARAVAARAIARSCRDPDLSLLLEHAREGDPLFAPSVEGLGRCLRIESAERLAALLDAAPGPDPAAAIARALGRVGAASIWSAPARRQDLEGDEIRLVAARALVAAVARFECPEARRAVRIVRHPATPGIVEEARRTVDPMARARLDALR